MGRPMLSPPYRDALNRLNDDGMREIARRLRLGEAASAIALAIGMSESATRKHCSRIASALSLPTAADRHRSFCEDVCRRAEDGATDPQIAKALGCSTDRVQAARLRLGGVKYRVLRFTPDESAEIDRLIISGERSPAVCAATGCTPGTFTRRKGLLKGRINPDGVLCDCGKLKGHGGMCQLAPEKRQLIRQRLIEGVFVERIAAELGMTAQNVRAYYAKPIIAELRAEGIACRCGDRLGHNGCCVAMAKGYRNTFDDDQIARARDLAARGTSIAKLSKAMRLTLYAAQQLLRKVRDQLKREGLRCGCGKPIDHRRGCEHRSSKVGAKPVTVRFGAAGRSMAEATRRKVVRLIREGWSTKTVCDRTGESDWRVTQVMNDVIAAGAPLPATCPGCEKERNHRGPCPLPRNCACGRIRNHRGPCRSERKAQLPDLPEDRKAWLWQRYHDGMSIRRMSEGSGVPFSTVQRAVLFWTANRNRAPAPCICGRPFRHPGGCVKNTPAALDQRWIAKIEEKVLAGETPAAIARDLDLVVATVMKHSLALRTRLFEQGVSCACGRPIGHAYWCSAKWDAYEMPRGRRALPEPAESDATAALLRGDAPAEIAEAVGVGVDSILRLRQSLTDDQQKTRRQAVRARIGRRGEVPSSDIMALVQAAVPRGIDGMVRDDVVAELNLAILEGRLETEQLRRAVKSFVNRGFAEWKSAFGPVSLDDGAPGRRSLAERVTMDAVPARAKSAVRLDG